MVKALRKLSKFYLKKRENCQKMVEIVKKMFKSFRNNKNC